MKASVLQLIDSFHQGGSERQAVQLTRLLHESGNFQVRIACLNPEGVLRSEIEQLDLGDIPAFPLNSFYDTNAVKQMRRLIDYLKSSHIDILHTHDFYTNLFGMSAGMLARVPIRIASRRETDGMRTSAQKRLQQLSYSLSHRIVANSEAVRNKLVVEGIRKEKVALIPNGLDLSRMSPRGLSRAALLDEFKLPQDRTLKFVVIVANMRHNVKDHPMFLRAARQVHQSIPDAAFLLAGEGELMETLRHLAIELGIGAVTFFLGRCEHVADLLSVADVCVLSSKAEGFSNSILEYMAASRPVVVTDVGGAREAVVEGETGYIVQSGDDQSMAQRIVALLQEPDRALSMGTKGRLRVEKRFSCDAQRANTEDLYERLLNPVR